MQNPFKSQSTFLQTIPTVVVNDIDHSLAFFKQIGFQVLHQEEGFAIATRDAIAIHFTRKDDQKPEDNWSVCRIVHTQFNK
ncbi:MAG: hypothetical protein NVSMB38_45490 [Ktedonobacteraceae bacterium]